MGGSRSGNHWPRWNKKAVVDDCLSLDANHWMREGILKAKDISSGTWRWTYRNGNSFSIKYEVNTWDMTDPFVELCYSWVLGTSKQQESADYCVRLTTSRPHFGGLRWWFVCPLIVNGRPCNRRVGKLYLPPPARYFGCRDCHDLTYTSCQESHKFDRVYGVIAREMGCTIQDIHRILKPRSWD